MYEKYILADGKRGCEGKKTYQGNSEGRGRYGNGRGDSDHYRNIYPIDYSIHYVDIVEKWKIYYCIDRSVYDVQWRL